MRVDDAMTQRRTLSYSDGILEAFEYLLERYPEVFVVGQGLWSPWYVGNSMKDLDKKFGRDRIIDSPVSEDATTAIAGGAALMGRRAVVVHPRIDFMVLASNSIVNQLAKWSHMLGGAQQPAVTIRGIVNRGGQQGAQHSQSLHSWYSHIPGLRVVMPATARDARELLVASVLCDDPVLYIDDRWCYEHSEPVGEVEELDLREVRPAVRVAGDDLTIVATSHSTLLAIEAAQELSAGGVSSEVIDLRVTNPLDIRPVVESVRKTGRLLVADGSWRACGLAGEVIAATVEQLEPTDLRASPRRVTLPDAPAPTSGPLEEEYYPRAATLRDVALAMMGDGR